MRRRKPPENPTCPRCDGSVELTLDYAIQPHPDPITRTPCPIRHMTIDDAQEKIDAERVKVGLPPKVWSAA